MSAWEGSALETVLKSGKRDIIIDTGAWTNMSIEHTARTGADKGYIVVVPEDCCFDHERRVAQRVDQLRHAECRSRDGRQ